MLYCGASQARLCPRCPITQKREGRKNRCTSYMLSNLALWSDSLFCFYRVCKQKVSSSSFPSKLVMLFLTLLFFPQVNEWMNLCTLCDAVSRGVACEGCKCQLETNVASHIFRSLNHLQVTRWKQGQWFLSNRDASLCVVCNVGGDSKCLIVP